TAIATTKTLPNSAAWRHSGTDRRSVLQVHRTDIDRLRTDETAFPKLLKTMCRPTKDPADSEGWCKKLSRESQTVQEQGGVELDVRIESAVRFALMQHLKRGGFDAPREVVESPVTFCRVKATSRFSKHVSTRIAYAINAMTKSHQPLS